MSNHKNDFPRDLRGFLLGGIIDHPNGSQSILLKPIRSYDNLWFVRRSIEKAILDPETTPEDKEDFHKLLVGVKRESAALRQRILEQFNPRPPKASPRKPVPPSIKSDHGVRNKMEKALNDIESGEFQINKTSKALEAVIKAMCYYKENGKMPSHTELRKLGFTNQEATDAGAWLADQHLDPVFLPLSKEKQGRRPKKK